MTEALDTTTPARPLMGHIQRALAEFERCMNCERARDGMFPARRRGHYVGRPVLVSPAHLDNAQLPLPESQPIATVARGLHVYGATLYRHIAAARQNLSEDRA